MMSFKLVAILIISCINFDIKTEAAPLKVEEAVHVDSNSQNPALFDTVECTLSPELIASIFVKSDSTDENTEDVTKPLPMDPDEEHSTEVGPLIDSRTILTVKENCQSGQKRDRKGRCRTVFSVN